MQKKKVVIYLYNRLFDPLIQSNFWLYVRSYLDDPSNPYTFHLITYEDPDFPLRTEQQAQVDEWQAHGLEWTALTWHRGTALGKKFSDLAAGFQTVAKLRLRGYRHIVALASVAGSFAYVFARLLGMKLFLYQFEPHSEYAIDNKMWRPDSLQFKLAHMLERKAAHFATVIASGTRFMEERLRDKWHVRASFFRIPTVANDRKFQFNAFDRDSIRKQLGIRPDQWVLFYPGKFGDLYYRGEVAWMFKWLGEAHPDLHFLIVTPHADEEVHALFSAAGVAKDTYSVSHSDYVDIHKYFSAADFAVIAVPPGPSKQFISNIKVGEYLSAGLPFLITRGVSEDYEYAEQKHVGVVVDDFVEADIRKAWPQIERYLRMPAEARRTHCRDVGLAYRGFDSLNPIFRGAMSALTA